MASDPEFGSKEWFQALKSDKKDITRVLEESLRPHEVVEMGHEVPLVDVSTRTRIGQVGKLAVEHDWVVKVGRSRYYSGDKLVKSTNEVKWGKEEDWTWVQGRRADRSFEYSANTCKLDGATVPYIELKIGIESA